MEIRTERKRTLHGNGNRNRTRFMRTVLENLDSERKLHFDLEIEL